jgi:hypothetical protein
MPKTRDAAWLADVSKPGPNGKRFDADMWYQRAAAKASGNLIMEDDVTTSQFTPGCAAYAGYYDGAYANMTAVRAYAASQGAKSFSYTVSGANPADAIDIEPGDASPSAAPGFYRLKGGKGVHLYGGASWISQIVAAMSSAGIARSSYKIIAAHYIGPHICGPSSCGYPQADATQFTDSYAGRSLDATLCPSNFFGATPTPAPTPAPVNNNGEEMTPGVAYFDNKPYFAVRGSNELIYYMGPDTNYKWQVISGAQSQSGTDIAISAKGEVTITYVSTQSPGAAAGTPCTYTRAPGGGPWNWKNLGGNVG